VAGAEFEKVGDEWRCISAAPIIKYMKDMSPSSIKAYIGKKGWKYEWLK